MQRTDADDDDLFLGPDDEPPQRRRKQQPGAPVQRMPRLPGYFVRVPEQWFVEPARAQMFNTETRLFFYVLGRSRHGQRWVEVGEETRITLGLSERTIRRALAWLERERWVRVRRRYHRASLAWPVVLSG